MAVAGPSRRVRLAAEGPACSPSSLLDEGQRTLMLSGVDWRPGRALFKARLDGCEGFTVQVAPAAEGFAIRHRAALERVLVLTPRSADLHELLPNGSPPTPRG